MNRLVAAWNRFWFPDIPAARLGLVRVWLCGYVVVDLLVYRGRMARGAAPAMLRTPYGPLRWLHAPRLGTAALVALWLTCLLLAVAASLGWRTRLVLPLMTVTYAWWVLEQYSYGKPMHARTSLVTALVALSLAPCARAVSLDSRRAGPPSPAPGAVSGWAVEVLAVSLAYLYVTAGLAKVHLVGWDWWRSGATQTGIALFGPRWAVMLATAHPGIVDALALLALVWELGAVALLRRGTVRYAYALSAVGFHFVVLAAMHVDFLPMAAACVALLPLERLVPRVARPRTPSLAASAG